MRGLPTVSAIGVGVMIGGKHARETHVLAHQHTSVQEPRASMKTSHAITHLRDIDLIAIAMRSHEKVKHFL